MRTVATIPKRSFRHKSHEPEPVRPSPVPLRHNETALTHLHRTAGNRAIGRYLQAKFAVSAPGDQYEQEADRVAEHVMRMPEQMVQRKCAACAGGGPPCSACKGEKPVGVSRKAEGASVGEAPASVQSVIHATGQPLAASTQAFFESRFGQDLSHVRVHTDQDAEQSARDVNALAYTVGSHVVFNAGRYAPNTSEGQRLLAHELTHVCQGGSFIRRCKDKSDEAKYDATIAEIKSLDAYKNLASKAEADKIITEGKAKPNCIYFAAKLKMLFTTPEKGAAQVATEIRKETASAVKAEEKRLGTKEAQKTLGVEETATADPEPDVAPVAEVGKKPDKKPDAPKKSERHWTIYPTRFGGGSYKVDATDMTNIFVKVKVNLVPRGEGTWDDVKSIKKLEDAIEKHASRKGFTLNLEFVNPENKADFVADAETVTIGANPKWPTATSWGSDAETCAHELFHVLNFPLDRYNYIESHAGNKKMLIQDRLHWFLEQMHKPEGFDNPESLMGGGRYPIEEDICKIAHLDEATCLKAREKLYPPGLDFRTPLSGILPTAGYANIGGSSGLFLNYGLDLGIPLTHKAEWELFIGAHGSFLAQLEGDKRLAFLVGARFGIERMWSRKTGGLNLGGFGEGGVAFVSDKESATASAKYLRGAYGYSGVNVGYKFSPSLANLSLNVEAGVGVTSSLGLHDPQTFVKDEKLLPFFTAGLRATWMF